MQRKRERCVAMKLIVFSDSHRELDHMRDVIDREKPDYVFHLGDHDYDMATLEREYPLLPVVKVCGNCDGRTDTAQTAVVTLGKTRFFLCHGHTLGVKYDMTRAIYAALEQKADVLLYGHTHVAAAEQIRGLYVLNPGSCGYDARPSYGYFILNSSGRIADWGIERC